LILIVKFLGELSTIGCKFMALLGMLQILIVKFLGEISTIDYKFMAFIGNISDTMSEISR